MLKGNSALRDFIMHKRTRKAFLTSIIHFPSHEYKLTINSFRSIRSLLAFAQVHTTKGSGPGQTEKIQGRRKRERKGEKKKERKKKWGNLLDRANMHDKARRREWRGLVCVERCVGDTKLRCELGEHDRTGAGAGAGAADEWMGNI